MRLRSATMAGVASCEQSSTTITSSTQGSCNTVSTTWRNVACSLYAGITTDRTGLGSRGESGENVMSICQSSFSFLKAIWIFGFQLQLIAPLHVKVYRANASQTPFSMPWLQQSPARATRQRQMHVARGPMVTATTKWQPFARRGKTDPSKVCSDCPPSAVPRREQLRRAFHEMRRATHG